jgi:predicted membrane metal-binding protein
LAVFIRALSTLIALALAIAAFCGASPVQVQPNPFGILFLGLAALIWFKWRRFKYGFDRPVMDDIAQTYWGNGGPKVPEQDVAGPRRRQ